MKKLWNKLFSNNRLKICLDNINNRWCSFFELLFSEFIVDFIFCVWWCSRNRIGSCRVRRFVLFMDIDFIDIISFIFFELFKWFMGEFYIDSYMNLVEYFVVIKEVCVYRIFFLIFFWLFWIFDVGIIL